MSQIVDRAVLSPQSWPFHLQWLPNPAYLVGGGVRDALRGCLSAYLDLDFVLPDRPVETAQAIAKHYNAGFVLLDAERQIARVVFDRATADFALQVGPSLISDLQRRDFTVNAIAYDPHHQEIIDPLEGYADLKRGVIRMVCPQNLAEDPLRLLRAYRQAAQLNFLLDPATQAQIRQLAPQLRKVAAERVRTELSYLLCAATGTPCLIAAWEDGLLQYWFPDAGAAGMALIAAMDRAAAALTALWPDLKPDLERCISDRARGGEAARRTLLATTKLTGLLAPNLAAAERGLEHLKYSRAEIQLVLLLLKCLTQVNSAAALECLGRRDQYFLFQTVGNAFPVLMMLAVAQGSPISAIAPLIRRYLDPQDAIAHPVPLLTGKDLITTLHLAPGPRIGQILKDLELAQAEGQITTRAEALAMAHALSS